MVWLLAASMALGSRRQCSALSASGYGLPIEADEGASATRSQTGRFEAEHEALGGRPVRQE
jgi:hypothetical protein